MLNFENLCSGQMGSPEDAPKILAKTSPEKMARMVTLEYTQFLEIKKTGILKPCTFQFKLQ